MTNRQQRKSCGLIYAVNAVIWSLLIGAIGVRAAVAVEAWQQEWEKTKAAAAKEGSVVIYGSSIKPAADVLKPAFKKETGIDLEFLAGRGPEMVAKVSAERRAGLNLTDMMHTGVTSLSLFKPMGITRPFSDLLFLPEVTNPKNWLDGNLFWADREKTILVFTTIAAPSILVNTNLIKSGEITSFLDLLKPNWKDKIAFGDPRLAGPPTNTLALLLKHFGREKGLQIVRQFAVQQPFITSDSRLLVEWVARGKYAVAVGASQSVYSDFKKAGAPVQFLVVKEPRFSSTGPGCISVFSNMPHPNASKLYINWLLSKKAATLWSNATGYPSRRMDVSKEGIDPSFIPRGDEIGEDEELRQKIVKMSADIFKDMLK